MRARGWPCAGKAAHAQFIAAGASALAVVYSQICATARCATYTHNHKCIICAGNICVGYLCWLRFQFQLTSSTHNGGRVAIYARQLGGAPRTHTQGAATHFAATQCARRLPKGARNKSINGTG
jgi:hypothetical protein